MLPKVIITDIDGVWTDGGMFYDQTGNEWKKFNTYDSAGVLWCKLNNIPVVIITGEKTDIVKRRAEKLNVEYLFMGIKNKVNKLDLFLKQLEIQWSDVAYLGDDINDYSAMQHSGYSACPQNSPQYIKDVVDEVLPCKGGDGAFRVFVEEILKREGLMSLTLDKYLKETNNGFNQ